MESNNKGKTKKFDKRSYLKQKLKTNFGSRQEGHGRAFIQKKAVVRQYFRQQRRDEERQRKKIQHQQSTAGGDDASPSADEVGRLELQSGSDALTKTDSLELQSGSDALTKTDSLELQSGSDALTKTDADEGDSLSPQKPRKKMNSWQRAKGEYHKKIAEKEQKKQEALIRRKEIDEAKRKYKEKRLQRFKKLNQKTKRGQPIMSGRIELMLEKLQEQSKA